MTLLLIPALYIVTLTLLVIVDWLTGWQIADAFGKTPPNSADKA